MNKLIVLSLILFLLFLNRVDCYSVSNPTWINSPYFCAGNNDIINSNTNGGQTRTQNIPFTVAFTGVPSIVYAIKTYKGNLIDNFKELIKYGRLILLSPKCL